MHQSEFLFHLSIDPIIGLKIIEAKIKAFEEKLVFNEAKLKKCIQNLESTNQTIVNKSQALKSLLSPKS